VTSMYWAKSVNAETANTEVTSRAKNLMHRNAYQMNLREQNIILARVSGTPLCMSKRVKMYAELAQNQA